MSAGGDLEGVAEPTVITRASAERRYNGAVETMNEVEPKIIERADHPISRKNIDSNAIKVLYRLHNSGYKGYLVGGSVRDLMLGREPKDFDIGTDARPNDLRKLFRNARIIGRRFRLAHVIFREGIIEVATFRRTPNPKEQGGDPEDLLITSDNAYGNPRQDAFRRDFTINGLFYNIADFSVIDYLGGVEDLERRVIRVIGDPDVRFAEDPVRMLRACEFAGRLGFAIESHTQEGIWEQRREMAKASPARLIEEMVELLGSGHFSASLQWMIELGLAEELIPESLAIFEAGRRGAGDLSGIPRALDERVAKGRKLSEGTLLAALLLPKLLLERYEIESESGRWLSPKKFQGKVENAIADFRERFSLSNARRIQAEQALDGFHRMCGPTMKDGQRRQLASRKHFGDALDLFEILVRATGQGHEWLEDWKRVPRPKPKTKSQGGGSKPRRRRRRRRRKS